ncbi:DUF3048 domain-containing protein [Candidatus Saccharibacteria bacterium]|nr:DUF3048 domain-containing protein [Candidatus Saccharibacteria bacterium]
MKKFLRRLTRKQKQILLAVGAVVLVAGSVVGGMLAARQITHDPEPETEQQEEEEKPAEHGYFAPLTGLELDAPFPADSPVMSVIIPNSTVFRTQSGLVQAEIVYEAIANSGVPRLLALFQVNQPTVIGPVRSMRPHYIDWAAPYQAALGNSGAAGYVLNLMASHRNIGDGVAQSGTYYREDRQGRPAEYTLYTSFARLLAASQARGWTTSNFTAWSRSDEPTPGQNLNANRIEFSLGAAINNVAYEWHAESGTWRRQVGGRPHMDREHGQIAPSVVIAMRVQSTRVSADIEEITTTGSGDVFVFQNGQVVPGRWRKDSQTAPLRFYDMRGDEIVLARGQTWITAVPNNNPINFR